MSVQADVYQRCQEMVGDPSRAGVWRRTGKKRWGKVWSLRFSDTSEGRVYYIEDPEDRGKSMIVVTHDDVILAVSLRDDRKLNEIEAKLLLKELRRARFYR